MDFVWLKKPLKCQTVFVYINFLKAFYLPRGMLVAQETKAAFLLKQYMPFVAVVAVIAADDRKAVMYYGKHRKLGMRKKASFTPSLKTHNLLAFSHIYFHVFT